MQKCQKTMNSRNKYALGPMPALCVNWNKIPSMHGCSSTQLLGQRMWTPIITLAWCSWAGHYVHSRWPWQEVYMINENLTQILIKNQKYARYHFRGFGDIKMCKSWSLPSWNLDSGQKLPGQDGTDNPIGSVYFQIPII